MSIVAETRLRVRYAETDQMGVVYYSNYLVWMEIGRTDFCLESGFRYRDMELDDGIAIAVADVHCRYHAPARYDDQVLVRTSLKRLKRRTMLFSYRITLAETETLLAEGSTRHVVVDKNSARPTAIPRRHYEMLLAAETPQSD